jgi:hypothetical protein
MLYEDILATSCLLSNVPRNTNMNDIQLSSHAALGYLPHATSIRMSSSKIHPYKTTLPTPHIHHVHKFTSSALADPTKTHRIVPSRSWQGSFLQSPAILTPALASGKPYFFLPHYPTLDRKFIKNPIFHTSHSLSSPTTICYTTLTTSQCAFQTYNDTSERLEVFALTVFGDEERLHEVF